MTKKIDIGALRLSEGFFLARSDWAPLACNISMPGRSTGRDIAFLHVHPESSSSNLKASLLDLIKNARRKVFIVSFILTDQDIILALLHKAAELKGRVYVVTCLDEQRLREGLADDHEDSDSGAAAQMEQRRRLTEGGVWLRGCSECHAKYALADDTVAIVSTSNFQERPLTQGGESGILLTNSEEVERIGRHFTRLWHERCDWDLPPGRNHTVARRQPEPSPCKILQPIPGQNPAAVWTDGNEHHILKHLQRVIDNSRQELLLATWDAVEVAATPEVLIDPLERAIKRGVRIAMLARRRNPSSRSRENMRVLASLGIELLGDKSNHAKGAIADKQCGVMFSANFDLTRGLTTGIEMGMVLDGVNALEDFHRYLTFAIRRATDVFVPSPTHAELNDRLLLNRKLPWPWEKSISVTAPNQCWNQFATAAAEGPVLFRMDDGQSSLLLSAGREEFRLARDSNNYSLVRVGANDNRSKWLGSLWRQGDPPETRTGFCPAVLKWHSCSTPTRRSRD